MPEIVIREEYLEIGGKFSPIWKDRFQVPDEGGNWELEFDQNALDGDYSSILINDNLYTFLKKTEPPKEWATQVFSDVHKHLFVGWNTIEVRAEFLAKHGKWDNFALRNLAIRY